MQFGQQAFAATRHRRVWTDPGDRRPVGGQAIGETQLGIRRVDGRYGHSILLGQGTLEPGRLRRRRDHVDQCGEHLDGRVGIALQSKQHGIVPDQIEMVGSGSHALERPPPERFQKGLELPGKSSLTDRVAVRFEAAEDSPATHFGADRKGGRSAEVDPRSRASENTIDLPLILFNGAVDPDQILMEANGRATGPFGPEPSALPFAGRSGRWCQDGRPSVE